MTAIERHGLSLQLDIVFRAAEQSDLPKLEWYGQYTHFRRVFQRAYEDQLAGRRLMLLADVNGWPIGQVFMHLESLDDMLATTGQRRYLYSLRVIDALPRHGLGTALPHETESILISQN